MAHILLDNMFEYELKPHTELEPNFSYNKINGYWTDKENNPCILNPNFSKPRTKKADRETGEDLKGE